MVRTEYGSLYSYITLPPPPPCISYQNKSFILEHFDILFQGTQIKDVKLPDNSPKELLLEKHADFIAAYGKKKDDYVRPKVFYLLQIQNDVRVVAQRCLTACHSLSIVGHLIICMVQCYISVRLNLVQRMTSGKFFIFHFWEKKKNGIFLASYQHQNPFS